MSKSLFGLVVLLAMSFVVTVASAVTVGIDSGTVYSFATGGDQVYTALEASINTQRRFFGTNADGGLDVIWDAGGNTWNSNTVVTGYNYTAMTHDATATYDRIYCAVATGGIDMIVKSAGNPWERYDRYETSVIYTSLEADFDTFKRMVATRADGGVDLMVNGIIYNILTNGVVYDNIVRDNTADERYWMTRDVGVDMLVRSSGVWYLYNWNTTDTYNDIDTSATTFNRVYAARADGGLDLLVPGTTYNVVTNGVIYTDIAADDVTNDKIYAARADGGIDLIDRSTGSWVVTSLDTSSNVYGSIVASNLLDGVVVASGVVPEPATIALLGLGAIGLIRRKK